MPTCLRWQAGKHGRSPADGDFPQGLPPGGRRLGPACHGNLHRAAPTDAGKRTDPAKLLRLLEKGQLRLLCGGICRAVERAVSRVNHRCETSAVSKFGDGTFHISFTYGKILKGELIAEGEMATIKSVQTSFSWQREALS